jgi:hypothetical protein
MVEVLSQALDERAALVGVCVPGEVVGFNHVSMIAQVRPVVLKSDGSTRPVLQFVPVVFPGVRWDVQVGETGLLIITDEDWRTWHRTGEDSIPETVASHELSNSFFIPGAFPSTNTPAIGANNTVVDKPSAGGSVLLGDDGAIKAALHEDLLTDLNTFLVALNVWGGTAHINWAAAAAAFTANVTPTITTLTVGIGAGSYESPSVKVED